MTKSMSITQKYQVTLPKEIRSVLKISSSDSVIFHEKNGRIFIEKAPSLTDIQEKAKTLMKKRNINRVSDAEMKDARNIFQEKDLKW